MPGDNRSWQSSDFVNNQMPTQLDSVGVTMNGESAHVGYISFNQINVLNLANGPVQIVVTVPPGLANGAQPIAVSSGGQVTLSGTLITDHN
jgi:hypothetical protein